MLGGMTSSQADIAKSLLLDGFGRVLEGVPAVVDGLTNDELLWRPDRDANSVAWLLWHLDDASVYQVGLIDAQDRAVSLINSLTDDDYDTVIDDRWDPPVTIAIRIVSVLDDAIKHLGQAEYVKGLLERRQAS